ncbi:MAG: PLP-dependent aminotransferase family protein [Egibacteraceae bacterium]
MPRLPIQLDTTSGEPLYAQLRQALEHCIAAGIFAEDERLPSSRQLATELGVSRNTVTTAYQQLLADGCVESYPRSGLFVNPEMRALPALDQDGPPVRGGFSWTELLGSRETTGSRRLAKPVRWFEYPYPFVGGQVDLEAFPTWAWARALRKALEDEHLPFSIHDGQSADDPLLVELICRKILPTRGVEAAPSQVLITIGSQQGLDLVATTLLGAGRAIAVENPGYPDAFQVFTRSNAELVPVPVDEAGMVLSAALPGVDVVYTTPSHHYPTNATLSAPRRRRLLAMAQHRGLVIVEDDYDSEFRYQGRPQPAVKSMDTTGQVVYLGSFSKFLAPGLRLGFVVAAPELIERLRELRRDRVRHPPGHLQRALALLLQSNGYQRSVRRARARLRQRWSVCVASLRQHLEWPVHAPAGGVSIWVAGPAELDANRLADDLRPRGVLIEAGDVCFLEATPPRNFFRLGYGAIALEAIEPGVRLIADAWRRQLAA